MHEREGEQREAAPAACRRFNEELSAHLEGEERPSLRMHVESCLRCGIVLAEVEAVRAASRALAEADEPPARLWSNVRAALVAEGLIREPQRSWERWVQSARLVRRPVWIGALATAVVAGVILFRPYYGPGRRAGATLSPARAAFGVTAENADYRGAATTIAGMEKLYQARAVSLDPTMKATYEQSLRSLDSEIQECLRSVRERPDDALARRYLVTAYTQEAQVLQSALEWGGQ